MIPVHLHLEKGCASKGLEGGGGEGCGSLQLQEGLAFFRLHGVVGGGPGPSTAGFHRVRMEVSVGPMREDSCVCVRTWVDRLWAMCC